MQIKVLLFTRTSLNLQKKLFLTSKRFIGDMLDKISMKPKFHLNRFGKLEFTII